MRANLSKLRRFRVLFYSPFSCMTSTEKGLPDLKQPTLTFEYTGSLTFNDERTVFAIFMSEVLILSLYISSAKL